MTLSFLLLLAGGLLLATGAELLVRGSVSLARRWGLSPLIIGLTVVAFGTSAPELVVSVQGAIQGLGDLAVGNVVGSNIVNIGLILGLAAAIRPIRIQLNLLRFDAPLLAAVSAATALVLAAGSLSRIWGGLLVAGLIAYTAHSIRMARRENRNGVSEEFREGVAAPTPSVWIDFALVLGGLLLLVGGSRLFIAHATAIARELGVSEAVIGLTLVAVGTSLPELATSVLAAVRRQVDIAVGNVIGSNLFNLLGILGTAALVKPLAAPGIHAVDLGVMIAFAVGLVPLLVTRRTLHRWEGLVLIAGYGAYLAWLWP